MPNYSNKAGYSSMRDSKEPQYFHPPGDGGDRNHQYHRSEHSPGGHVTLPPIAPYESYLQSPPYNQDQRPYSEQMQGNAPFPREYHRANQQGGYTQSAPRQRTAIACRYCRRRKIRCSGFDQNPEGRCINCQRFQQECIFTPVSSHAQAFVPAHTVYPGMRNMEIGPDGRPRMLYPQGATLFGAHGQPLPPPAVVHQSPQYEYPAPSPTSPYSAYGGDERGPQYPIDPSRARAHHEPNLPTILPPIAGQLPSYPRTESARHGQYDEDLRLPPVTPTASSPASIQSPGNPHPMRYAGHQYPINPQYGGPGESRVDPMRLGTIMESRLDSEIDRNMLGRLGRRG